MSKKRNDDFTPIIIGRNQSTEDAYKRDLESKRRDLKALDEYCSTFVSIDNKTILFKDFKETFLKMFYNKYASQFPSIVTLEKMIEFSSVDMDKIETLATNIESIKIDLDKDYKEVKEVDFNIYTTTQKDNLLYATMKRICQDFDILKENGVQLHPMSIQNGTMQTIKYDWRTQSMQPNLSAVHNYSR
tara:strand:- start:80 stop:643 length:564 start_codon:yes stop_codon:yes gene_type:complete